LRRSFTRSHRGVDSRKQCGLKKIAGAIDKIAIKLFHPAALSRRLPHLIERKLHRSRHRAIRELPAAQAAQGAADQGRNDGALDDAAGGSGIHQRRRCRTARRAHESMPEPTTLQVADRAPSKTMAHRLPRKACA
jgi:hypothetical protein